MHFVKIEGCGNDYLFLDEEREQIPEDRRKLVKELCHPHYGPGADGVVFYHLMEDWDAAMEIYNADGSRAEMCGNAIRGLCLILWERIPRDSYRILTDSGVKECGMIRENGTLLVQVDMGAPVWEPGRIPCCSEKNIVVNEPIRILQEDYRMTCVSMGNPHAVIFVPAVSSLLLEEVGLLLEHHLRFPNRTNVEFVQIMNRNTVKARVWERGVGETLACGTGACAILAAGRMTGRLEEQVQVRLSGGTLQVRLDPEKGNIYLTGPVRKVYEGEYATTQEKGFQENESVVQ